MAARYEWDPKKERTNKKKRGVDFGQARALLESSGECLEIFDEAHSFDEDRFITIGPHVGDLLVVVWAELSERTVRIISARWATAYERRLYREYLEASR